MGEGVNGRDVSTISCFIAGSSTFGTVLLSAASSVGVSADSGHSGRLGLMVVDLFGFVDGVMDFLFFIFFDSSGSDSCSSELLLALTIT